MKLNLNFDFLSSDKLVFTILALVAPGIFGNDNADEKRQDKRGVVNVGGLGGHYPGAIAAPALAGYGAYGAYGGKNFRLSNNFCI